MYMKARDIKSASPIFGVIVAWVTLFGSCGALGQESQSDDPLPVASKPLRDLNSYFPFQPPTDLKEWDHRKEQLQEQLRLSLGLIPEPPRPALQPVIHGRIEKEEYTIEKVYFESMPGFFVTGNLYRPKNTNGLAPGILSPHGHHRDGRFRSANDTEIDDQIKRGAEKFRSNARSPLQARCAHLAKMGCVVFHYDMIGYADSQQISNAVAHGFSTQVPADNQPDAWTLFSPLGELNQQSVMGLQTWNSIRALDFLCSLNDVDKDRIGVTGASGGGTQTFILCALDDRPEVSFPAVMVSTAMQGGCTCENCSYLRIGAGNVDFAAMFAPKPLGLTAADDWTHEMSTKGFPELQQLYRLYDKAEDVQLTSRTEFEHNYNQVSREAMYAWFKKHLQLSGSPQESEIEFVDPAQLTVFDEVHPRPPGGVDFEKALTHDWARHNREQLQVDWSLGKQAFETHRRSLRPYLDLLYRIGSLSDDDSGHSVSFEDSEKESSSTVWLIRASARPDHDVNQLSKTIGQEHNLLVIDQQHPADFNPAKARSVNNPREALAYTSCYNAPPLVKNAAGWFKLLKLDDANPENNQRKMFVVGLDEAGLEVAINAHQLSRAGAAGLVIQTDGYRFANIKDIRDPNMIPGALRYHDLPGFLSLAAPTPMMLIGETEESAELIVAAYKSLGARDALTLLPSFSTPQERSAALQEWLTKYSK